MQVHAVITSLQCQIKCRRIDKQTLPHRRHLKKKKTNKLIVHQILLLLLLLLLEENLMSAATMNFLWDKDSIAHDTRLEKRHNSLKLGDDNNRRRRRRRRAAASSACESLERKRHRLCSVWLRPPGGSIERKKQTKNKEQTVKVTKTEFSLEKRGCGLCAGAAAVAPPPQQPVSHLLLSP